MSTNIIGDLIELGQGPNRVLDCIIAVELPFHLDENTINQKIRLAQTTFPQTARHKIQIITNSSLIDFTNMPLERNDQILLAIINEDGKQLIALKMSHVLGDAISMLMWLKAFFGDDIKDEELKLKEFPRKKDTPYRKLMNSQVWMQQKTTTAGRNVLRQIIKHQELPDRFKLNDLLILSLLRSLKLKHKSIWIPVNVRENFLKGFGNGLSRVRIYPNSKLTTKDQLEHIRQQKREAYTNGEISLPPKNFKLDSPLKKTLLNCWLKRPWADWSTISLSHIEDKFGTLNPGKSLWGVSNIIEKHMGAVFVFSDSHQSYVTLTLDQQVPTVEGEKLLKDFKFHFEEILHELSHQ